MRMTTGIELVEAEDSNRMWAIIVARRCVIFYFINLGVVVPVEEESQGVGAR
jgi:hypothetical protein